MTLHTKLIYQQRGELRHYLSKVLSVSPISALPEEDRSLVKDASAGGHAVSTDETIFYVQGGGQPSDTGILEATTETGKAVFEVSSVRHSVAGPQVFHFGRFTSDVAPGSSSTFKAGDAVQQRLDAEKRDLHSRLHTAGHILGLAINALSREGVLPPLIESKASHYPDSAAVEFGGLIEGKHKAAIQARTDAFVAGASKVVIHWWPMERLLKEGTGVTSDFRLPEGEVLARVVEMEGLGAYPCGGTHVTDCSLVGKIEVKKISRSKGISRVSYRVS